MSRVMHCERYESSRGLVLEDRRVGAGYIRSCAYAPHQTTRRCTRHPTTCSDHTTLHLFGTMTNRPLTRKPLRERTGKDPRVDDRMLSQPLAILRRQTSALGTAAAHEQLKPVQTGALDRVHQQLPPPQCKAVGRAQSDSRDQSTEAVAGWIMQSCSSRPGPEEPDPGF